MRTRLRNILPFFLLTFSLNTVFAAYLNRPELVDFNFAGANICEKVNLKIKFDHQNFNAGNVFTAEISPNGSFAPGNTTTLVGSLTQSGSQNSVIFSFDFPTSIAAGSNYRLRIKGSNPLTFSSDLNEHPFSISKLTASDPNFYPTGYWRGYFYRWTPSTTGTINDATNEDIFNASNYIGYISEDTMSFNYNWGSNSNAPGIFPDTNRICGTYRDFFSIRLRRRVNFSDGYYIFGGGGDDGFRLSIDGGLTWLIQDWNDHSYRGSLNNGGCGIFLTAGQRDVVVEFYENKTDAQIRVVIIKTGDPAVNPISISNPTNGATICAGSSPIQMVASPPGAWQWSGIGVSSNGILNPQIGAPGQRTISYQTGFSAFGQNCVKQTSITVNVALGISAQFSGLPSEYCTSSASIQLIPQNPGGIFSGPGVAGLTFSPSIAGVGLHTISHIISSGGCSDTVKKQVLVSAPVSVSIQNLPVSVCNNSASISLVGNPSGGTFSGSGVSGTFFNPGLASIGNNAIAYSLTSNGCTSSTTSNISVSQFTTAQFSGLVPDYCTTGGVVNLTSQNPGNVFSGTGVVGSTFSPSIAGAGNFTIRNIVGQSSVCPDTAYFQVSVLAPVTPIVSWLDSVCSNSNPVSFSANISGTFSGPGMVGNSFNPSLANIGNNNVMFTSIQGPCTVSVSKNVKVVNKLIASLNISSLSFCKGQIKKAGINVSPIGGILAGAGIIGDSLSVVGLNPGSYPVQYIVGSGTCVDTAKRTFNVFDFPNASFVLPDTVCEGSKDLPLKPADSLNTTYQFADQGVLGQFPNFRFSPSLILKSTTTRVYNFVTKNGCTSSSEQFIYILEKFKPKVLFPDLKSTYCSSDRSFIPVSNPPGQYFMNGQSVDSIKPSRLTVGNYSVKSVYRPATSLECIDSSSAIFNFKIIETPKPDLGRDLTVESGQNIEIDPKIPGPYSWTVNPVPGLPLDESKPIKFKAEQNVVIKVIASDVTKSCFSTDSVFVKVTPALFFPNLFTPDGDGENDSWFIANAYPNMEVKIFNRWGKEIYKGIIENDIAWKGEEAADNSIYFYSVTNPADGRIWSGWVMVKK